MDGITKMDNMTREDLANIGVVYRDNKIHPNKFYIPHVGDVNLYEPYRYEDILQRIYNSGYHNGTYEGERRKLDEIKRVLRIEVD